MAKKVVSADEPVTEIQPTTASEITEVVVEMQSSAPFANPNDVLFEVKYASWFEGKKTMPLGETVVSKETAEILESRGFGKVKNK